MESYIMYRLYVVLKADLPIFLMKCFSMCVYALKNNNVQKGEVLMQNI